MSTPTLPQPTGAPDERPLTADGFEESSAADESVEELDVERALPGQPYRNPFRLGVLLSLMVALGVWRSWVILIVILAVVLMIFFHELGHYLAARRADMAVTEFFIGFGPRIFSFVRGETEYGLKAIPAGAYVKVIGMTNVDEIAPELEERTYRRGTYFERVRLAAAGPASHFVMSFILLFVVLIFSGSLSADSWTIGSVAPGSSADDSGIQEGDVLVELGGTEVATHEEMAEVAQSSAGLETTAVVIRDGEELVLPFTMNERLTVFGTIGQDLVFYRGGDGNLTVTVPPDSPIEEQGLKDGSIVTSINGVAVSTTAEVAEVINAADSGSLDLEVLSGTQASEMTLDMGNDVEADAPSGFFGVGQNLEPSNVGVLEAVPESGKLLWSVTTQTLDGLRSFFTPSSIGNFVSRAFETSPGGSDEVSGTAVPAAVAASTAAEADQGRVMSIVGAVAVGEQVTQNGWADLLLFMVTLNVVIGLFNLIPLPPFDGGHIVVATYEKVRELIAGNRERYLSDANKLLPVAYGVLGFFMIIGVMALYLDLADPVQL